jgi:hypothetical protein
MRIDCRVVQGSDLLASRGSSSLVPIIHLGFFLRGHAQWFCVSTFPQLFFFFSFLFFSRGENEEGRRRGGGIGLYKAEKVKGTIRRYQDTMENTDFVDPALTPFTGSSWQFESR